MNLKTQIAILHGMDTIYFSGMLTWKLKLKAPSSVEPYESMHELKSIITDLNFRTGQWHLELPDFTGLYLYFLSQPPRPFIFLSSWCLDIRKWHWTPFLLAISVRKLALICVFLRECLSFALEDTGQSGHFHHHRWLGIPLCVCVCVRWIVDLWWVQFICFLS